MTLGACCSLACSLTLFIYLFIYKYFLVFTRLVSSDGLRFNSWRLQRVARFCFLKDQRASIISACVEAAITTTSTHHLGHWQHLTKIPCVCSGTVCLFSLLSTRLLLYTSTFVSMFGIVCVYVHVLSLF